ncbi:MAG: hypothetical protein AMXMBFR84_17330 [Candidatus Hydrogenedentota bacterium]
MNDPRLSVIIPAYNEADRIGSTLTAYLAYLNKQSYRFEIIVVDDGSKDGTTDVVRNSFPGVQVIGYYPNRGKGHAVRTGLQAAAGAFRLFSDADASTPIEEIEKFWPCFERGAEVVIGSRSLPESDVEVHQAWYREGMGRVFNAMVRALRLSDFTDTQCGFKAFTANACEVILPRQTIDGFAFDAEMLYIASKHNLRIEQVPVHWINSPKSRVNPITDSSAMIGEIVGIRVRDWRGAYD